MTLILLRHGASSWNDNGTFCGWVDADLHETGFEDAERAAQLISDYIDEYECKKDEENDNFQFDICYTSVLKRSIKTANTILNKFDLLYIPMKKDWRLNERHYGMLTGKHKHDCVKEYGKSQVSKWRRSWNDPPPPSNIIYDKKSQYYDRKYIYLSKKLENENDRIKFLENLPKTEALLQVYNRVKQVWNEQILTLLKAQKNVLCVIHGTSARALVKIIENDGITNDQVCHFEVPNGYPLVYKFDKNGNIDTKLFDNKMKENRNKNNNKIESECKDNGDCQWIIEQSKALKIEFKIHGKFLGDLNKLYNAQNEVKNQINETNDKNESSENGNTKTEHNEYFIGKVSKSKL